MSFSSATVPLIYRVLRARPFRWRRVTLPSLVLILTIFMIVGLNEKAAVVAAALPVIPILTINIWEGIKGVDQKLIDMSRAYHASQHRIIFSVIAPQIAPTVLPCHQSASR